MANVQLFVKIGGADAESVVPIVKNTTRVLADWLTDAGHNLETAKVAVLCPGCEKLLNPGLGTLCNSCAQEEALERQLQEIIEGRQPVPQLQPAEAMF